MRYRYRRNKRYSVYQLSQEILKTILQLKLLLLVSAFAALYIFSLAKKN